MATPYDVIDYMQTKVIRTSKNWAVNALAYPKGADEFWDDGIKPTDPKACKWCLLGAKQKAVHDVDADGKISRKVNRILAKAIKQVDTDFSVYNYSTSPTEIITNYNDGYAEYQNIREIMRVAKQIAQEAA